MKPTKSAAGFSRRSRVPHPVGPPSPAPVDGDPAAHHTTADDSMALGMPSPRLALQGAGARTASSLHYQSHPYNDPANYLG